MGKKEGRKDRRMLVDMVNSMVDQVVRADDTYPDIIIIIIIRLNLPCLGSWVWEFQVYSIRLFDVVVVVVVVVDCLLLDHQ